MDTLELQEREFLTRARVLGLMSPQCVRSAPALLEAYGAKVLGSIKRNRLVLSCELHEFRDGPKIARRRGYAAFDEGIVFVAGHITPRQS